MALGRVGAANKMGGKAGCEGEVSDGQLSQGLV